MEKRNNPRRALTFRIALCTLIQSHSHGLSCFRRSAVLPCTLSHLPPRYLAMQHRKSTAACCSSHLSVTQTPTDRTMPRAQHLLYSCAFVGRLPMKLSVLRPIAKDCRLEPNTRRTQMAPPSADGYLNNGWRLNASRMLLLARFKCYHVCQVFSDPFSQCPNFLNCLDSPKEAGLGKELRLEK